MPIMSCELNGKPGYKYGESGHCYTYTAGNEQSRKRAEDKAKVQAAAIHAREHQGGITKLPR